MDVQWREWLGAKFRAWAGFMLGVLAAAAIGGVALVGAIQEGPSDHPVVVNPAQEGNQDEGDAQGHEVVNHGRCVSRAAHAANEAGVRGPARGAFMRAVAEDESMVTDKAAEAEGCDFEDALAEAAAQTAEWEATKGKPEGAGKPEGEGEPVASSTAKGGKAKGGTGEGTDEPELEEEEDPLDDVLP